MEAHEVIFRWDGRVLVDKVLDDEKISKEKRGRYFMYKRTDPDLGLPQNDMSKTDKCESIYGDAFVFRLEGSGFSKSERARYAKMGSPRDKEEATAIILALCSRKDEIDASRDG